jgi:hypothetical protein
MFKEQNGRELWQISRTSKDRMPEGILRRNERKKQ